MGFYIRKSVSVGPFRFNLSKSGAGLSVGIKGLRVGTGPRGHYIHAGAGGFYYRTSLRRAGERLRAPSQQRVTRSEPLSPHSAADGVEMVDIDSGDILEMRDERSQDLLDEINARSRRIRLSRVMGASVAIAGALLLFVYPAQAHVGLAVLGVAVAAYFFGRWLDSYRRSTVLFYDLEPKVEETYRAMIDVFERLSGCAKAWHVPSGGAVRDITTWKRNAGASHIINRKLVLLRLSLPEVVKCNIDVPMIAVGAQSLYFFPDFLMVCSSGKAGTIAYGHLQIRVEQSNFIEDGSVPSDSTIIRQTWQHPNKSGGPDRRYKSNRQIPVCAYEAIQFSSHSGLNELVQVSTRGRGNPFAAAVTRLATLNVSDNRQLSQIEART